MSRSRSSFSLIFTGLMLAAACYAGDGRLLEPGDSSSQPGDVKKKGLTLTVVTDSALAAALGWESNAVAGAEVIVQRGPDPGDRDTVVSDEDGVVKLERLVPGDYKVWGSYVPPSEELDLAEASGYDVRLLGGALRPKVPSDGVVQLFSDQPGSLVISEIQAVSPRIPYVSVYRYSHYIELYNNSDTTIYLDGKVIGSAYSISGDYGRSDNNCDVNAWFNLDPDGIWGMFFQAFPGSGREHSVEPGQVIVVARDAIDHTSLHPGTLDLSNADFEFFDPGNDVDNPAVPNMVLAGLRPWPLGHGWQFNTLILIAFIAEPFDVADLPRGRLPISGAEMARVPAANIIDVAVLRPDWDVVAAYGTPECPVLVHPSFDRMEGMHIYGDHERYWYLSVHRKVAGVREDGGLVLQRTRVSALDFFVARQSPGVITELP